MRATGIEPATSGSTVQPDPLQKQLLSDVGHAIGHAGEDSELGAIHDAWPHLAPEIRAAIARLSRAAATE